MSPTSASTLPLAVFDQHQPAVNSTCPPQRAVDAGQTWVRASHFSGETVVLRTTHIRKVLSEIGMRERPLGPE